METIIILILYLLVVLFHLIPIIKKKEKKEIWFSSIVTAFSFIILILVTLGIEVPSPTTFIKAIIPK